TATPTRAPTATATATSAPKVPVKPRLVIALPPPAEQQTVPYTQSQVSEKLNAQYDHLIGRNILTNEELPELATSWSIGADGKTWTFNLRQGVPFYKDGKPIPGYTLSVRDLQLTWELLNGEGGPYGSKDTRSPGEWTARLGSVTNNTKNWQFPNDFTAIMVSPNINLDIGFFMSDEWESGVMSIQHWTAVGGEAGYRADPVGNGPWTYMRHSVNQDFLHKRVESHYRRTPEFHERHVLLVVEAATRQAALLAKEVDIIPLIRAQRNIITGAGFKTSRSTFPSIHQAIGTIYYREDVYCVDGKTLPGTVPPCGKSPGGYDPNDPLRKPDVRLALNHALDRPSINTAFLAGGGFPSVDYFPPWRSDFKDAWAPHPGPEGKTGKAGGYPYDYNPTKAKQLLTQAGYPNGFNTILNCLRSHNVVPEWPDICEKIKQDFGAVGVNVSLEMVNAFGEFRNIARARNRPNWMWGASPSLDPICRAVEFSMVWELGIGYREFEEISTFYAKCKTVSSVAERDKIAQELGDIWVKKAFTIPTFWVTAEIAFNPSVVADYTVNMLHMGPVRYHEYTKAVTK
ncbi:MAG: ABC transporter substrate-binding protein, partial [SAR202 cluster bacterium]|nr:ABC transporter substrate-binding protein [SAR202 cluster bacterium]